MMRTLVFFLEEPSAEEMLKGILPKILPENVTPEFKVFEGKQDLEKRLPRLLRAWKQPNCLFVVMRDQDSGDCQKIKRKLSQFCSNANLAHFLVRIACRELESFYLGDLSAVEKGLDIAGLSKLQNKAKYRAPDNISCPSDELDRLTKGHYQHISGSRCIGPHLDLNMNRSHSFTVLLSGIHKLVEKGS